MTQQKRRRQTSHLTVASTLFSPNCVDHFACSCVRAPHAMRAVMLCMLTMRSDSFSAIAARKHCKPRRLIVQIGCT